MSEAELQKTSKPRNIHISRQALRAQFLAQLSDEQHIAWGHCLKGLSYSSKSEIELEFQVGEMTKTMQADLVVGADGIRSRVRSAFIGEEKTPLQYLGCIVILGICPLKALENIESSLLDGATVFQTVNGHQRIYMMPYDTKNIMWQLSFPIMEEEAKLLSKKGSEALKQEGIARL